MRADDIVRQRFTKVFRGYDVQEVDLFLDEVIRTLDELERERNVLLSRVEALLNELDRYDALLNGNSGAARFAEQQQLPESHVVRQATPPQPALATQEAKQAEPQAAYTVAQRPGTARRVAGQAEPPAQKQAYVEPEILQAAPQPEILQAAPQPEILQAAPQLVTEPEILQAEPQSVAEPEILQAAPVQQQVQETFPEEPELVYPTGEPEELFIPGHPMGEPPPLHPGAAEDTGE